MKLSDVVNRINGNVDRYTTDLLYYIGGEHFESNELEITNKAIIKDNLGILGFKFHFAFQDRDVIFMARNPHLRKAGMVRFSGLCSDASYILRSKDENILTQEYLAIQLQSDHFWDYCESHKVGSVNFANNWSSIANYEFDLPTIDKQREIADKVWAAYEVKKAYRSMIKATDEMVKSQFIEMFGSMDTTPVGEYVLDSFPGEWGIEDTNGTGVKVIRTTNFTNSGKLNLTDVITREIEMKKVNKKRIMKYDTILERSGGTTDNPVGRVVLFEEDGLYLCNNFTQVLRFKAIDPRFAFYSLFYFYQTNKTAIRGMGNKTTGIQNLNMSKYLGIGIPNALVEQQKAFTAIAEQADKSKFMRSKSQFIEMLKGKAINGTISDLVAPKIANVKKTYSHDDTIKYIDISSINAEVHAVSQVTEYSVKNAPSRAQQCVKYGDLLVSTVRPINRNIAIVDKDLDNLVASTGFCVLRPNDGMLNYLLSIVLSDDFTNAMCDKANGGVYPAVNNGDVLNYQIHIPDDDLAKRASLVRQQADKSKFELKKAIEAIDKVIKSLINENL